MVQNSVSLPEGYGEFLRIDLQQDKKLALLVNGLALLIGVVMVAAACLFVPLFSSSGTAGGDALPFLKLCILLAGLVTYFFLHEAVHGVCMKAYGGAPVRYGFTGLYAYAGSAAYFNKRSYRVIALAPVVVWGLVLILVNCLVPPGWFWVVYIIQVCNISGAAGDLYVTWKMSRMPADILIQDTGVSMTVYARTE